MFMHDKNIIWKEINRQNPRKHVFEYSKLKYKIKNVFMADMGFGVMQKGSWIRPNLKWKFKKNDYFMKYK